MAVDQIQGNVVERTTVSVCDAFAESLLGFVAGLLDSMRIVRREAASLYWLSMRGRPASATCAPPSRGGVVVATGGAMSQPRLVALFVLVSALAPGSASAQPFPVPFPLPPLPPPSFDMAPPDGRTEPTWHAAPESEGVEPAPPVSAAPAAAAPFAPMRTSSDADREALRLSRIHETWYGWETLGCDAAAIAVLLLGAAVDTTWPPTLDEAPNPRPLAFAAVASGIYLAGPTTVHFVNGDLWQGFASAGLRIAMPLVGFILGSRAGLALQAQGTGAAADGAFGAVAGGVTAMVIDASALGWHRWYGSEPAARVPLLAAGGSF